jgi:voltage-dependent anion channel protein 2
VDYVMPYLSLKSSIALTSAPVFDVAAATSYKSFLLGAEAAFDTGKSKVTKSNVALGYSSSDYSIACVLSDVGTGADLFSAAKLSYAHTVSPTTSAGAEITRKIASGDTSFALAYSKKLESGASSKVKIDNTGALTGYYETKLVSGEKVASSLQVQVTDLAKPLKFGFAVDLA